MLFLEEQFLYFIINSNIAEVHSQASIENKSPLVQIMTQCYIGAKPLPKPIMLTQLNDACLHHQSSNKSTFYVILLWWNILINGIYRFKHLHISFKQFSTFGLNQLSDNQSRVWGSAPFFYFYAIVYLREKTKVSSDWPLDKNQCISGGSFAWLWILYGLLVVELQDIWGLFY